jgi:hypothetical protein
MTNGSIRIMEPTPVAALRRLEERWRRDLAFQEQLGEVTPLRQRQATDQAAREEYAREMISLIRAGRSAGRFNFELYVYYVNFYLRNLVHEGRLAEGRYDPQLATVRAALERIRTDHQLPAGEPWLRGQGSAEYESLNDEYERLLESMLPGVLREFGESEVADLLASDPARYEALERAGARIAHQQTTPAENLELLVLRYKREGEMAGEAGAYYAACAMLGAAIEASLLALCYRHPLEAENARRRLNRQSRPDAEPERWSLLDLVVIAVVAGWIPALRTDSWELSTSDWVRRIDQLRQFRNLLHPGKHLATRPWIQLGKEDYEDARAIFEVLDFQLKRVKEQIPAVVAPAAAPVGNA